MERTGRIYVIIAAALWALCGITGQILTQQEGIDTRWMTTIRLLLSGAVLLGIGALKYKRDTFQIFKSILDVGRMALFGLFGCGVMQITYFCAIKASNAATATFLQYLSPAVVIAAMILIHRKLPSKAECVCMVLAIVGTFLIATHGDFGNLKLSKEAVIWGLIAAVALAFYTVYPGKLIEKYGLSVILGWSFLVAGAAFTGLFQPWTYSYEMTGRRIFLMAFLIIFGTIIPFMVYSSGVQKIGGAKANILATIEPLISAVVSGTLLKVEFSIMDYAGFACILSITFVLAWSGKRTENNMEEDPKQRTEA